MNWKIKSRVLILLLSLELNVARADMVVISEIMYQPPPGKPAYLVIENLTATPFDMAEWRFTDGIRFTFPVFATNQPTQSFLPAHAAIVLSSESPAQTRSAYHISPAVRVCGPWQGKLNRTGERLTLEDKNGVPVCSVKYGCRRPWPLAADGTGHSLVLKSPNRAVDDWRNWRASIYPVQQLQPGKDRALAGFPEAPRLNEVHFAEGQRVDWVELHNPGPRSVWMRGLFLATRPDFTDRQPLDRELFPGGFEVYDTPFHFDSGEFTLFLINAANVVLDCQAWSAPLAGESRQAFPDGNAEWYATAQATPGQANHPERQTAVVINEIMYDPPDAFPLGEYVELYNRGTQTVDLAGWHFDEGIDYEFPPGTRLAAGAYLVIAKSRTWMREAYGDIPVAGNFKGKLSNHGERIRLVDARDNLVDEVDYGTDGAWPAAANGGGSSLELTHPDLNRRRPSAWQASDESGKAPLHHYACTNTYRQRIAVGKPSDYKELHLWLVGRGHVVLENLALMHGNHNCLPHPLRLSSDGTGATGWLCQGTHWASYVTNGQFHIVSDGRGDHKANRVELDVPALQPGETYVLQFDARWLAGKPRLVAQSWDRSLAGSFLLEVPRRLGTPGRVNSQAVPQPGPQIDALAHQPPVPKTTDPITVTARVSSVAPLSRVQLRYQLESATPGASWRSEPMFDDGATAGDAAAGDGIFTTTLPPFARSGQVVQFYVSAAAANGPTALLPRRGAAQPALLVVDDQVVPRDLRSMRVVVSARTLDILAHGNTAAYGFHFPRPSSHYFNATLIREERQVDYNVLVRNSGSVVQRSGDLRKVKLKLPADRALRGHTKYVYDDDAASGRAYHNRLVRYLLYRLGHPANENEFVRLLINAGPPKLREEVEPVGKDFLKRNFVDGNQGELYRMDLDWWFIDDWEARHEDAQWTYRGTDNPAAYRNAWLKRTRETADDYSHLIAFFKAVSQTNTPASELDALIDAEAMLKMAAVRGYIGDWDTFTMQRGRNAYFYRRPTDGRFQFLHWDSDEGYITEQPFYGKWVKAWIEQPRNLARLAHYLKELNRICVSEPARLNTWLALERAATSNVVQQAAYTNFFRLRGPEAEAFIQEKCAQQLAATRSHRQPKLNKLTAVANNEPR